MLARLTLAFAVLAGCAHPVEDTLAHVRSAEALPVPVRLVYDERSAVLGGQRIELDEEGKLVRHRWRPGFAPALESPETLVGEGAPSADADLVTTAQVPVGALRELAALLLELEAWDQQAEEDAIGRVDDSRTTLRIVGGGGDSTVWEYSQDRARLQRVKLALEALMTEHGSRSEPSEPEPALVDPADGG